MKEPSYEVYEIDGQIYTVFDTEDTKKVEGPRFNSMFYKKSGVFWRCGSTPQEDPQYNPVGPELLDTEISIDGCPNLCKFCYKGNTKSAPTNMSLETFKTILGKFPKTLTQVAFGITGIQTNPDFISMMQHCRDMDIVPNFTLSGIDLTPEIADQCAKLIGAVAVSIYADKDIGYDTVHAFTSRGVKQTNIHLVLSQETLPHIKRVLADIKTDLRLKDLNAVVFLTCKPKGRASTGYHPVDRHEYINIIKHCIDNQIMFGFDSCGAPLFDGVIDQLDLPTSVKNYMKMCTESCESGLFSAYVDVYGRMWPCSFSENAPSQAHIDVLSVKNFQNDLWYATPVKNFRERLYASTINGCRVCPLYNIQQEV